MTFDAVGTKQRVSRGLARLALAEISEMKTVADALFHPHVISQFAHPFNELAGVCAMVDRFWIPLKQACPDLERRDDIMLATEAPGGAWVAATGYYYGTFIADWLGIPATDQWIAIRYGEFYRLESDRIVELFCIIDFIDVMRQSGLHVLPPGLGVESLVPPPATQDGCMFRAPDPHESQRTRALVEAMIFDGLLQFDGKSSASIGMEHYWDPDMMWFGPGGIGTTRGLSGFLKYHQEPFQNAFPDWKGVIPLAVPDGHFMAAGGWPSIHCTHSGVTWLGLPASGRRLSMRVMDWWRREGDWLKENWIFIDIPHVLLQAGVDVFAAIGRRAPSPGEAGLEELSGSPP